ncbi:MAG: hypothetical protein ACXWC2_01740 [Ramlibacter sp.]
MAAEAAARAPGRRVLLVEDNEDGRQVMEMVLALEGHTVRPAAEAGQAAAS